MRAELTVTSTDIGLLGWLVTRYGGTVGSFGRWEPSGPERAAWRWTVRGRAAGDVLERTLPYMRVKTEEARLFIRLVRGEADAAETVIRIKALKRREVR